MLVTRATSHKRAFFFSSRGRHTRSYGDWSSDVCSSDLGVPGAPVLGEKAAHLGAELLVLCAVLEVHERVLPDRVGRLLTASGVLSRAARSPRSGRSPS